MKLHHLALLSTVVILAACGSGLKAVKTEQSFSSVIVLSQYTGEIGHTVSNNPVKMLGLSGMFVASAADSQRAGTLRNHVGDFNVMAVFQEYLEAALKARGTEVAFATPRLMQLPPPGASIPREQQRDGFGLYNRYQSIRVDADAQLDIVVRFAGFASAGVGDDHPYYPAVAVNVRVVSADGRRVLFQNAVSYNIDHSNADALNIDVPKEHAHASFQALASADPQVLSEQLHAALRAVAARVAAEI